MVLGHKCMTEISLPDLDLTLALDRISSPHFYFGLTDRWDESICLFHKWYGGEVHYFELQNNRPSIRIEGGGGDLDPKVDLDVTFIQRATHIFNRRLKESGCANATLTTE